MKGVAAALAAALVLLLCGCSLPSTELENRLVVSAVGIDASEEGYTVTLSYLSMHALPGEDTVPAAEETTSTGITLNEAFRAAESNIRGSLFWGHTSYVVLGERSAAGEIDDILKFLYKNTEIGIDVGVCAVRGLASQALEAPVSQREGVAKALDNVLKNNDLPCRTFVRLFEMLRDIEDGGCSGMLPVVEVSAAYSPEQGEQRESAGVGGVIDLVGAAVFSGGRERGFVSGDNLETLMAMMSRSREKGLAFAFGDCTVFAALEYPSVRFSVSGEDTVRIEVSGQLEIDDVLSGGKSVDNYDYTAVKRACEEQLEREISGVFCALYRELGVDIFKLRTAYALRYGAERADEVFSGGIELYPEVCARLRAVA